ncbi:MAG: gamma-glutamyl-gamma-aminobutyrate hydrolase family protein [Bacteroidetes bacterium]|nr:gamma-glutamyl-gamma-aminobutyrate hydrolase family protein [Bacteroidota bacterium]
MSEEQKIVIGITHADTRGENYGNWIKGNEDWIEVIDLSSDKENWDEIADCDGIVLTGGLDAHPRFYNSKRDNYPNKPKEWNEKRDEFEMHVFETALNFDHPVLAICRGLQLVNVSLGGDLIQDLEEAGKNDHRRHGDQDEYHGVEAKEGTLLHQVTGAISGKINTAHHQAAGKISEELMISATSPDGVVEALEWKEKEGEPWMLCVQWHPERMEDGETNPFSKNIRERFLEEVKHKKYESNQPIH